MSEHPMLAESIAQGDEARLFEHADDCESCRTALLEEGLYAPGCSDPALGYQVLLHLDVLIEAADSVAETVREHASACAVCAAELADGREALGELEVKPVTLAAVSDPGAPSNLAIAISCVFCHDRFERGTAVYCATCLAPHHPACFTDHGRCSVLGCEETRFVRPQAETVQVLPEPAPQPRHRWRRWATGGLLCALAGAAAFWPAEKPTASLPSVAGDRVVDPVVATVNGQEILRSELEQACALQPGFLAPYSTGYDAARSQSPILLAELDALIEEAVLLQMAAKDELSLTPEEERGLPNAVPAGASELLLETVRKRARARLLIDKLLGLRIGEPEPITSDDVLAYYERNRRAFNRGGETRLREIVIHTNPQDARRVPPDFAEQLSGEGVWDGRRAATQLSRAKPWLTVESSFAQAAERYSMGAPELQVFATDDMEEVLVPPLGAVVNGLEEGDVSPLVQAYTGSYHVVQLVSRRVAVRRPLGEVVGEITRVLKSEGREEHRRAWVAARLAEADVKTFLSITIR